MTVGATTAFVHFAAGGGRLGVPLEEIREVARVYTVAPVPRAPAAVRGLANIRGRIVTLLDADVIYGRGAALPPEGPRYAGHAVVLCAPREHLALFTRSRVDIGRGQEASVEGESPGGPAAASDPLSPPLGALVQFQDEVIHLVPTADLAAHCEARVLERYRQRR